MRGIWKYDYLLIVQFVLGVLTSICILKFIGGLYFLVATVDIPPSGFLFLGQVRLSQFFLFARFPPQSGRKASWGLGEEFCIVNCEVNLSLYNDTRKT